MKYLVLLIGLFYSINVLATESSVGLRYKRLPLFSPPTDDKIFIDFVGNGDLQKSLTSGDELAANTGLGVVFERVAGDNRLFKSFEFDLVINVASTVDSITAKFDDNGELDNQRDFGGYIINPTSAKQAFSFNSKIYFGTFDKWTLANIFSGIQVKLIGSNNVWSYEGRSKNISALLFRLGAFHEFIPDNYRFSEDGKSLYSVTAGFHYTLRTVLGDISSFKNEQYRSRILGTDNLAYHGIELNLGVKLRNIQADVQLPIINKGVKSIDGLTNTQLITSIRFIGGFPLKLNITKKKAADNGDEEDGTVEEG